MSDDPYNGRVILAKRALLGSGWCCAPKSMNLEEVQLAVHREIEPYIPDLGDGEVTPWTVVPREHIDPEYVSPGRCADCPDIRQHWFMIGGCSGVFLLAMGDHDGVAPDTKVQDHEDWEKANATTH